ncbi:hypothetical protein ACN6KS_21555 [Paenibacillus nitricinens]|uniref:hypothetical protein n=1 Tax=Paenibacillus nitricinens TaxID=3367691 RepID=UPI003F870B18
MDFRSLLSSDFLIRNRSLRLKSEDKGERSAPTVPNFLSVPSPSPHFVVDMGSSHSYRRGDSLGKVKTIDQPAAAIEGRKTIDQPVAVIEGRGAYSTSLRL